MMSKQSKFTKCLMEQLGYTNKIYGEEFFSPRQKELFPGLKRDLNMEIEDAARSDDPLEACMERRGYKPSKTQVFQDAISAKLTADMFGKQEKLTGAEAMFQEQMQECLDRLKNKPKLKFADIKSTMATGKDVFRTALLQAISGVKFKADITENQIRSRVSDPKKIVKGTYFTRQSTTPGVSYVMGQDDKSGKFLTQSIRFDRQIFNTESAKRWFKNNIKRVQARDAKTYPYPKPYYFKSGPDGE